MPMIDFSIPNNSLKSELRKVSMGDSEIGYQILSDGTIDLYSIRTKPSGRGKGSADRLLSYFLEQANKENRIVSLLASPLIKKTHLSRLVDFYKRKGFSIEGVGNMAGDPKMVRKPISSPKNSPKSQ